jgi:hypothetical protein
MTAPSWCRSTFSPCGTWRWRLDREVAEAGLVFAFFGVNGSTAGPVEEDHTTMKWRGFTVRNGGRKFIAGTGRRNPTPAVEKETP